MAPKRTQKISQCDKKQSKSIKETKCCTETTVRKNNKSERGNNTKTGELKMTLCTYPSVGTTRPQGRERRSSGRPTSGKRLHMIRDMPGKLKTVARRSLDPCDNSNDSGLGFDQHADPHANSLSERLTWNSDRAEAKRIKMDIKMENEDANDRYSFPESVNTNQDSTSLIRTTPGSAIPTLSLSSSQASDSGRAAPRCIPLPIRPPPSPPIPLTCQMNTSDISLKIIKQPEQQHRARYQTEGSRGAVKDREGNGFPVVQLLGYYHPATLQVFIGTDAGKVAPHMFYQACKVSGKNSTPCSETKIEGTCVIELQLDVGKEMSATCDCVGILKERNVDVEHRFPEQLGNRSKKKSTKCRMIFRTTITHDTGTMETLQVCSQPIICTQPPGIPEICKKSISSCPASGGLELFVLGKNFLKDTKVYFQQFDDERRIRWEELVLPDKEYLQQSHFVCIVPPYRRTDITEPITVRICVVSSGKTSEAHQFVYTPVNGAIPSVHVESAPVAQTPFFNKMLWASKHDQDVGMMPPPESSMVPMSSRRPSISLPSTSDTLSPPLRSLKQEFIDENSQNSMMDDQERYRHISESSLDVHPGDSNMSMINDNSIDMLSQNTLLHSENSNLSNENSVEVLVRRRSITRVCESSLDVNLSNSQMSAMNEDSSCSNVIQQCSSSVVTDRMVMSQPVLMHPNLLSTASHSELSPATSENLNVIDLRMKLPMATVADLANSNAPSMATLRSFGVVDAPLPPQSAQSVENFLTNIESKTMVSPKLTEQPVFLSGAQRSLFQNENLCNVAKSEAAAIAEALPVPLAAIRNISPLIDTNARLDQFVNSTVESHIGSPEGIAPKPVIRDVMLTTRLGAPMINPTLTTSPILPELSHHTSPNLSPAVILSSQMPPSLLCQSSQAGFCGPSEPNLLTTNPTSMAMVANADPEKAVLFKAAVDLFVTQKQLSELGQQSAKMMDDYAMPGPGLMAGASAIPGTSFAPVQDNKAEFQPAKDMAGVDKKAEDTMIPQSFTSLTETELIDLINPSCFDQV